MINSQLTNKAKESNSFSHQPSILIGRMVSSSQNLNFLNTT